MAAPPPAAPAAPAPPAYPYLLRLATAADAPFIERCFALALNYDEAKPFRSIREWQAAELPDVWAEFDNYTAAWDNPRALGIGLQIGVIAEAAASGERVGGAWLRRFTPAVKGFAYLDARTPEFAVGVEPAHRGRGVGTRLLLRLFAAAHAAGCARLSLSAGVRNPALRLYLRMGARRAAAEDVCAADFSAAERARASADDAEYPNFIIDLPVAPPVDLVL